MDDVFRALADASRRELLDRLHAQNGQTLNELCARLVMKRQAVSKHLAILEDANLVATVKRGREKLRPREGRRNHLFWSHQAAQLFEERLPAFGGSAD